jgi:hypothetical protein
LKSSGVHAPLAILELTSSLLLFMLISKLFKVVADCEIWPVAVLLNSSAIISGLYGKANQNTDPSWPSLRGLIPQEPLRTSMRLKRQDRPRPVPLTVPPEVMRGSG